MISPMDVIKRMGIQEWSTNWKIIEGMLDQARKEEAEEILTWFIKYMLLESRDKYSTEELYQLFKQSK